jgi:hypothetical protein
VFNPFHDPQDPAGSAARLAQFLGDAFADGRAPDLRTVSARALAASVNGIDPDFTVPENRQLTLGVAHELARGMAVSADLVYSRPRSLLVWRNENVTREGRPIDPEVGGKIFAGSLASARYRALALRYDLRRAGGFAGLAYTWAKCADNTSGTLSGETATNPFDLEVDAGPCDTDVRHTVVARGGASLPLGFEVSGILAVRSGAPYSAVTSAPLPLFTRYEARNARRGASFVSLDGRLARSTRITDRVSAKVFVEGFNLLNRRNIKSTVANVLSARFGEPTEAHAPRRLQLGLRVEF